MDMAGGAGAAPSAQRQQLVEAVVADHLHDAEASLPFDRGFASVACDDRELGHVWKLSLKAEKGKESAASYARRSPSIKAEGSRTEEHTSELQSLMRISYAVFRLKKQKKTEDTHTV